MRGLLAASLAALAFAVLAPSAFASSGTTSTGPLFDGKGRLIKTPLVPGRPGSSLTQQQALRDFERYPKVADHVRVVTDGRGSMPAWRGTLTAAQIGAVVAFERTGLG